MARPLGGDLDQAIVVGLGQAAQPGEAVGALDRVAAVDAGRVGMPKVDHHGGHDFAAARIEHLHVQQQVHPGLVLADVVADQLARHVWFSPPSVSITPENPGERRAGRGTDSMVPVCSAGPARRWGCR